MDREGSRRRRRHLPTRGQARGASGDPVCLRPRGSEAGPPPSPISQGDRCGPCPMVACFLEAWPRRRGPALGSKRSVGGNGHLTPASTPKTVASGACEPCFRAPGCHRFNRGAFSWLLWAGFRCPVGILGVLGPGVSFGSTEGRAGVERQCPLATCLVGGCWDRRSVRRGRRPRNPARCRLVPASFTEGHVRGRRWRGRVAVCAPHERRPPSICSPCSIPPGRTSTALVRYRATDGPGTGSSLRQRAG